MFKKSFNSNNFSKEFKNNGGTPPPDKIIKLLNSYGLESYICGGTARDRFLGREPAGYDIAVKTTLSTLRRLLQAKIIRVNELHFKLYIKKLKNYIIDYEKKKGE